MTTDGRHFLSNAGLLVLLLGVLATSLFVWFFAGLTFFGEPLEQTSYVQMAVGFGAGAGLMLLTLVPALTLGAATWVRTVAVVLAVLCLLAAASALAQASSAPKGDPVDAWWWPLEIFAWSPATWLVVLLVAATPRLRGRGIRGQQLRGSSSPTPR